MLAVSLACTRDAMSAGWPPLICCLGVRKRRLEGERVAQGYRDGHLEKVPDTAGVSPDINSSLKKQGIAKMTVQEVRSIQMGC